MPVPWPLHWVMARARMRSGVAPPKPLSGVVPRMHPVPKLYLPSAYTWPLCDSWKGGSCRCSETPDTPKLDSRLVQVGVADLFGGTLSAKTDFGSVVVLVGFLN